MANSSTRGLARRILRDCRYLGSSWTPRPPASDLLWGRGFPVSGPAPHPLLKLMVPQGLEVTGQPLAAQLREELRREAELPWGDISEFLAKQRTLAICTSTSEKDGLRVEAVSGFVKGSSNLKAGQYVFSYNMRFTNRSDKALRVLARQYDFRDGIGELASQISLSQAEAAGIVGYTPLIAPGSGFEFGSGVALSTPRGSVTGKFLVMVEPELSGEDAKLHERMSESDLMMRYAYFRSLDVPMFHLPLGRLRFDSEVPVVTLQRGS
eukprot:TRINITY_DN82663_c0_g1_i1.p1 TRINITY_DN82663_c0_g1~~TRINITY_DN82663_c0_g1_i1.p1  ORF type:complete len:266 (+),score=41.53 TRINITY_DN82663_c0_g1_i1:70-867(+)